MFKIDYALDMLSDPEISSHCNVSQLVKRLNDKKTELIKQYDTWCVNQLMPNELIKTNPSFDIQFENFKDVICKYKENKIIFDSTENNLQEQNNDTNSNIFMNNSFSVKEINKKNPRQNFQDFLINTRRTNYNYPNQSSKDN